MHSSPCSNISAGEGNRTPKTLGLSERCLPVASLPRIKTKCRANPFLFRVQASPCASVETHRLNYKLVAESRVTPDDLLIMSQPSLIPAPPPHKEHAVRIELTMTGFANRRLDRLGYACVIVCHLSLVICPLSFVICPLLVLRHLLHHLSLVVHRSSFIIHHSSFIVHRSSFIVFFLVPAEGVEPSSTGF